MSTAPRKRPVAHRSGARWVSYQVCIECTIRHAASRRVTVDRIRWTVSGPLYLPRELCRQAVRSCAYNPATHQRKEVRSMSGQVMLPLGVFIVLLLLAFVLGTLAAHPRRDDQLAGAFARGLLT